MVEEVTDVDFRSCVKVRAKLIDACIAEGFYPDYDTWDEDCAVLEDGRVRWTMKVDLSTTKVRSQV